MHERLHRTDPVGPKPPGAGGRGGTPSPPAARLPGKLWRSGGSRGAARQTWLVGARLNPYAYTQYVELEWVIRLIGGRMAHKVQYVK